MSEYNGWRNRQTWNVALWLDNDEPLYRTAVAYAKTAKNPGWIGFVRYAGLAGEKTPDGIAWDGTRLDTGELSMMLREMKEEN